MRKPLWLLTLLFVTTLPADEPLPPPPANYSWQRLPAIKSALLKPDGWFFSQTRAGKTEGFFVTLEEINESGSFQTGLTLNCLRDVSKKSGQLPSAHASSMADAAAARHHLIQRSSSKQGPFRGVIFRYVDAPAGKQSVTVHQVLIANDKTGTLFVTIFEAPTKDWDEAWKTGEVILKKMLLDDEV